MRVYDLLPVAMTVCLLLLTPCPSEGAETRQPGSAHVSAAAAYLGGTLWDEANAVAVGPNGDLYVVGTSCSDAWPVTAGAWRTNRFGGDDIFVARFDPALSNLLAVTWIGGSTDDSGKTLAVAPDGTVYVGGQTWSQDFVTTTGAADRINNEWWGPDGFVCRFDASLSNLLASTYLGRGNLDSIEKIRLAPDGSLYAAGQVQGDSFPATTGAYARTFAGIGAWSNYTVSGRMQIAAGAVKLLFHDGDAGNYVAQFQANELELAKWNNLARRYTTLAYIRTNAIAPGAWFYFAVSVSNRLITLDLNNTRMLQGQDNDDQPLPGGRIALATWGDETADFSVDYLGVQTARGWLWGDDFQDGEAQNDWGLHYDNTNPGDGWSVVSGGDNFVLHGTGGSLNGIPSICEGLDTDAFVARLAPNLNRVLAATYLGGIGEETVGGLCLDSSGRVFLAGNTMSPDFPTTGAAYDRTFGGNWVDYQVGVQLRIDSGFAQINVRHQYWGNDGARFPAWKRYFCHFSTNNVSIHKEGPPGQFTHFANAPVNLASGTWHSVGVTVRPSGLQIQVDGLPVLSVADTDPLIIGGVSLAALGNNGGLSDVQFDDLVVSNNHSVLFSENFDGNLAGWDLASGMTPTAHATGNALRAVVVNSFAFPNEWVYEGWSDAYIACFDPGLSNLLAATFLGDTGEDGAGGLTLDASGQVCVAGTTWSEWFPTTDNAFDRSCDGRTPGYVALFDPALSRLAAATFFDNNAHTEVNDLVPGPDNTFYVAGLIEGGELPGINDSYDSTPNSDEGFILRVGGSLTNILAATYLGGCSQDAVRALAIKTDGSVVAVGYTESADFPVTHTLAVRLAGERDAFAALLDSRLRRAAPRIAVNPLAFNFGLVPVGSVRTQLVTVANNGPEPLRILTVSLPDGEEAGHFATANDQVSNRTLAPDTAATILVTFCPTSYWGKSIQLRIVSNDPDSPTGDVLFCGTGVGTGAADVAFSQGLSFLANYRDETSGHPSNDLLQARHQFQQALALETNHYAACVYAAIAGLLAVPFQPNVAALLDRFGVSTNGRALPWWDAQMADPLPTNAPPLGELTGLFASRYIAEFDSAIQAMARIPTNWPGSVILGATELPIDNPVQFDATDARFCLALFEAGKAALNILRAHDLGFNLNDADHHETPRATISVDGDPTDWTTILPACIDTSNNGQAGLDTDIARIYTAMDSQYGYVMIQTRTNLLPTATVEFNLNFRPGSAYEAEGNVDLHVTATPSAFQAWTNRPDALVPYPLRDFAQSFGNVFECRIRLSELDNPSYFAVTFANLWRTNSPAWGDDPVDVAPLLEPRMTQYRSVGTITNSAYFTAASNSLVNALGYALQMIDCAWAETDLQTDDLFVMPPEDRDAQHTLRNALAQSLASLQGQTSGPFGWRIDRFLNLGYLFADPLSLRDLLRNSVSRVLCDQATRQLDLALANLATAGADYNESMNPTHSALPGSFETDYGDVLMMQAQLTAWKTLATLARAYEPLSMDQMTVDPHNRFSLLLSNNPTLLTVTSPAQLLTASGLVAQAIDYYQAASAFIRAETDEQSNDYYRIEADAAQAEAESRARLTELKASLSGPVWLDPNGRGLYTHLGRLFSWPYVTRNHAPQFNEANTLLEGSFPDPTFNGLFPYFTQWDASAALGGVPDDDADGVPDAWERQYFGDSARDMRGDSDGDGLTDLEEYIAGTAPNNTNSLFQPRSAPNDTLRNGFLVYWQGTAGRRYSIYRTTQLPVPFELLSPPIPGHDGQNCYTDRLNSAQSRYYYKVGVKR